MTIPPLGCAGAAVVITVRPLPATDAGADADAASSGDGGADAKPSCTGKCDDYIEALRVAIEGATPAICLRRPVSYVLACAPSPTSPESCPRDTVDAATALDPQIRDYLRASWPEIDPDDVVLDTCVCHIDWISRRCPPWWRCRRRSAAGACRFPSRSRRRCRRACGTAACDLRAAPRRTIRPRTYPRSGAGRPPPACHPPRTRITAPLPPHAYVHFLSKRAACLSDRIAAGCLRAARSTAAGPDHPNRSPDRLPQGGEGIRSFRVRSGRVELPQS